MADVVNLHVEEHHSIPRMKPGECDELARR
jgi:hypothetical protein